MKTFIMAVRQYKPEYDERAAVLEWIDGFKPETEFGKEMIALMKQGLEEGVELMDEDELREYLGRPPYAEAES